MIGWTERSILNDGDLEGSGIYLEGSSVILNGVEIYRFFL